MPYLQKAVIPYSTYLTELVIPSSEGTAHEVYVNNDGSSYQFIDDAPYFTIALNDCYGQVTVEQFYSNKLPTWIDSLVWSYLHGFCQDAHDIIAENWV